MTHPKFEIEKEYLAVIAGGIEREEILKLQSGVIIDGIKTAPCKIKRCDATEHTTSLSVILHEGRNRQGRKMFEAIGKNVLHLTRIRACAFWVKAGAVEVFKCRGDCLP